MNLKFTQLKAPLAVCVIREKTPHAAIATIRWALCSNENHSVFPLKSL